MSEFVLPTCRWGFRRSGRSVPQVCKQLRHISPPYIPLIRHRALGYFCGSEYPTSSEQREYGYIFALLKRIFLILINWHCHKHSSYVCVNYTQRHAQTHTLNKEKRRKVSDSSRYLFVTVLSGMVHMNELTYFI